MSQALYRKWRPHLWEQVIGQEHVIQTLRNSVAAGRIAHAYIFAGPRGTGKTTTARLLAKAANCLDTDLSVRPCDRCEHCQAVNQGRFLDLIEIDAASNTSVDDVRDLRDKINFSPNLGRYKVYIIDEVHMLSTAAFNALLKTLEEPPPHAIFILATTEVHKIPATVLSRCQRHEFRRIPVVEIVGYLKRLVDGEGIQIEPEALQLIARQATGAMRDAISLLDQLSSTGGEVTLALAQKVLGTATSQAVLDLVEALQDDQPAAGLQVIHRTLDAGSDPRQFARQIVDYLRNLILVRMGNAGQVDATPEIRQQMARHAQIFSVPALLRTLLAFNRAAVDGRAAWQPSLPLELAFVESLAAEEQPAQDTPPPSSPPKVSHPKQPEAQSPKKNTRLEGPADQTEPPAAAVEAVPQSGSEESVLNKHLEDSWRQILALVRKENSSTYGLLNSCRLHHLSGHTLTLGFASDILVNQMEKKSNLELVLRVLKQVMESEIQVRTIMVNDKRSTPPPDVDSDGLVAAALRDLGGEIVDIK